MSSLSGISGSQPVDSQGNPIDYPHIAALRRRLDALGFSEQQAQGNLAERAGVGGGSLYDPSYGAAQQDIVEQRQRATQEAMRDAVPQGGYGGGGGRGGGGVGGMREMRTNRGASAGRYDLGDGRMTNDVQMAIAARKMRENQPDRSAEGLLKRQQEASWYKDEARRKAENDRVSGMIGGDFRRGNEIERANAINQATAVGGSHDRYNPAPTNNGIPAAGGMRGMAVRSMPDAPVMAFGRIETRGNGYYDGSGIQLGVPGQGGWSGGRSGGGGSRMGFDTSGNWETAVANRQVGVTQSPTFARQVQQMGGGINDLKQLQQGAQLNAFRTRYGR